MERLHRLWEHYLTPYWLALAFLFTVLFVAGWILGGMLEDMPL